jgi:hypothetical protein
VPRARPYLSAREAFVYLVLFGTLYTSAYYLASLLFDFINQAFPDPATSSLDGSQTYVRSQIRWAVSTLIVTLFVAAGALIGDVTTLVYNLLGGELTIRFVLKVLIVGAIAGTAFTYYLRDLRLDEQESKG